MGQALCRAMASQGQRVRAIVRESRNRQTFAAASIEEMDESCPIADRLSGVEVVIHCAARAHILRESSSNPLEVFRQINRDLTIQLARDCVEAGVTRFIYLSSIGVLGNTSHDGPLRENAPPRPCSPYAISKLEGEEGLKRVARESGLQTVILRLPLIYGPNPKGNFGRLLNALQAYPLFPSGAANNRRSFLGLANLCSAVSVASTLRGPKCSLFHLADAGVISFKRLLEILVRGLGHRPWLVPVPKWVARMGSAIARRPALVQQLFEDLEVSADAFMAVSGWRPEVGLEEGLLDMATAHRGAQVPVGVEYACGDGKVS